MTQCDVDKMTDLPPPENTQFGKALFETAGPVVGDVGITFQLHMPLSWPNH